VFIGGASGEKPGPMFLCNDGRGDDFRHPDGKPVQLLFLVVSKNANKYDHLKLLAQVENF